MLPVKRITNVVPVLHRDRQLFLRRQQNAKSRLATSASVHFGLGLGGGALDIDAACAGWLYGLVCAEGNLSSGQSRCSLVVGSGYMERLVKLRDRSTGVLFGNRAGATVPVADDGPTPAARNRCGLCDGAMHAIVRLARWPVEYVATRGSRRGSPLSAPGNMPGRLFHRRRAATTSPLVDLGWGQTGMSAKPSKWGLNEGAHATTGRRACEPAVAQLSTSRQENNGDVPSTAFATCLVVEHRSEGNLAGAPPARV